jgi:predicted dehydrogenase
MLETLAVPPPSSPAIRRPRLGFAGVGWIGRNRLTAIAESGLAEIAAIGDVVAENSSLAAEQAPNATITTRFEDLLSLDLDGLVIATPSALHAQQVVQAAEAGLAVFCQKPLGRNAEETQRAIDAARAANRLLAVDLSYRFTTGMQRIRELIQSGALGRVYAIEAVFHNAYGPDKPWFYDPVLAGGGCLLDLGIHLVDLALWCLGFPEVESVAGQVMNQAASPTGERFVEEYAAAQLRLSTGTSLQLACSWKAPAGCDARIELTFFGTHSGATFRNIDGSFYNFVAEQLLPHRSRRALATASEPWGGRAAVAWVRQLALSPAFDPDIEHLQPVAATLDRIYQCAR